MATIQLVTFVALALCLASAQPFLPGLQVLPYSKGYIKGKSEPWLASNPNVWGLIKLGKYFEQ